MAHQFCDDDEVGVAADERGGEGVAKDMGGGLVVQAGRSPDEQDVDIQVDRLTALGVGALFYLHLPLTLENGTASG
jgi:hypothetical protein